MNETLVQFFQVKPKNVGQWPDREVVFMNDAFHLDSVQHISPVQTHGAGIQHYFFSVLLDVGYGKEAKELRYDFANRGTAVKAQRVLCAAYTKTGEYEVVKEETDPITKEARVTLP